jgi:hypothetical protein
MRAASRGRRWLLPGPECANSNTTEGVVRSGAKIVGMTEHVASRTLVKSPPELWAECSSAESLARHLGQFGEIRITRLEPETAVAWEGEDVCGTVRLEPSGWGTKVVLTARPSGAETQAGPGAAPSGNGEPPPRYPAAQDPRPHDPRRHDPRRHDPRPHDQPPAAPVSSPPRRGFLARLRRWFGRARLPEAGVPTPATAQPPATSAVTDPVSPPPATAATQVPEPEHGQTQSQRESEPGRPEVVPGLDPEPALTAALDSLGQAHRRPFSRA